MKITLISITHVWPEGDHKTFFCLAPAYLKLYVEAQPKLSSAVDVRLENHQFTAGFEEALDGVASSILDSNPDLVGFSCYQWNMTPILRLCRLLKDRAPGLKIVLGGPDAAPRGEELLRTREDVDFVCYGEGERTFADLLDRLHRGLDASGVRGLIWRKDGAITREAEMPSLSNLDLIPSPYLSGIVPVRDGDMVTIETTRGCPYICKYCDWQNGQPTRNFAVDRVLAEVDAVVRQARDLVILFADADIFTELPRAKELIRGLSRIVEGRSDVFLLLQNYLPRLDDEAFALLNKKNFLLGAGVQSTNPAVLRSIARFFDKVKVEKGVRSWKRLAPESRLSMHLIYALPGESVASFRDGLQWTLDQRPSKIEIFRSCSLPGAAFGRTPEAFGIVAEKDPPYRILSTGAATAAEIEALHRWIFHFRILSDYLPLTHGMEDLAQKLDLRSLTLWDELIERCARVPDFGLERTYLESDPFDPGFFNTSTIWKKTALKSGAIERLRLLAVAFAAEKLRGAGRPVHDRELEDAFYR
jgi:hypothetical protein